MGRILDLIYPENIYCACCDDCIDSSRIHGLCDACIEKIEWTGDNPFSVAMDDFSFDDVLTCAVYGAYPRTIIYKMKLQANPYIARGLGKLMGERARQEEEQSGVLFDSLIPVPCTRKKKLQRGFNQAELLAEYAAKELKRPVLDALEKLSDTKSARMSSGSERRFLQNNNFAVKPDMISSVSGKRILLVDDVITTGSTADECARILKNSSAAYVAVLCFASTAHV